MRRTRKHESDRSWLSPLTVILAAVLMAVGTDGVLAQTEEEEAEEHHRVVGRQRWVVNIGDDDEHRAVFIAAPFGRGFLGVQLLGLTDELRVHFGVPEGAGVMVSKVVPDSPAAAAGIHVGDILTSIDGDEVTSATALSSAIRHKEKGDVVDLDVWRDGRLDTYSAEIAERERAVVDFTRGGTRYMRMPHVEVLPSDQEIDVHVDPALEHLQEYFGGDEWKERVRRFETLDWRTIEERMREVEKRLKELEGELEEAEPE